MNGLRIYLALFGALGALAAILCLLWLARLGRMVAWGALAAVGAAAVYMVSHPAWMAGLVNWIMAAAGAR